VLLMADVNNWHILLLSSFQHLIEAVNWVLLLLLLQVIRRGAR
jgi:hypothetical protein